MVGWKERLVIYPEKITIHAKIDTGADSSALDAEDIVEFKRDGRKWIRFTVKNRFGEQVRMERPLKRNTLIKQHDNDISQSRPVISLGLCLAGAYMEEDVSLVNRSHFTTQMLIGRTFTAGTVIIDPAQTYISEPNCQNIPEAKVVEAVKKPAKKAPIIKAEDLKEEVVVEVEKEGNE